MSLLNRWAQPRAKGIPQGFSASDILAKIYLNPIDRALRNGGFTHLRYVDDIRIFCKSRLEAKRGLLLLNDLMRKRGLNLQSAKIAKHGIRLSSCWRWNRVNCGRVDFRLFLRCAFRTHRNHS